MVNINNSLSTVCHSVNAAAQPKNSRHAPSDNVAKSEDVCKRNLGACVKSSQHVVEALNIMLGLRSRNSKMLVSGVKKLEQTTRWNYIPVKLGYLGYLIANRKLTLQKA